jgi:hypothetical protein
LRGDDFFERELLLLPFDVDDERRVWLRDVPDRELVLRDADGEDVRVAMASRLRDRHTSLTPNTPAHGPHQPHMPHEAALLRVGPAVQVDDQTWPAGIDSAVDGEHLAPGVQQRRIDVAGVDAT